MARCCTLRRSRPPLRRYPRASQRAGDYVAPASPVNTQRRSAGAVSSLHVEALPSRHASHALAVAAITSTRSVVSCRRRVVELARRRCVRAIEPSCRRSTGYSPGPRAQVEA